MISRDDQEICFKNTLLTQTKTLSQMIYRNNYMLFKNKCRINANYVNILGIHMKMWQHCGFCLRYFVNIKGLICDADWFLPFDHFIIILSFQCKYWFFKFCLHRQWVWCNIPLSLGTMLVLKSVSTWKNTAYKLKNIARLLNVLLDLPSKLFEFFKLLTGSVV